MIWKHSPKNLFSQRFGICQHNHGPEAINNNQNKKDARPIRSSNLNSYMWLQDLI